MQLLLSCSDYANQVTSRSLEIRQRLEGLNNLFIISENSQVPSSWKDFLFRGCLDCLEQSLKQETCLQTERTRLWNILEHLCTTTDPSSISNLTSLPDLIQREMEIEWSEERLTSIQNILCSMVMERLTLDTLTSLVTILSKTRSSSTDLPPDCYRNVFCICLASLLKTIINRLKGKNSFKASLDSNSKALLLAVLAWRIPCCTLDPCPSCELRKQTVRRLVFCTFSLQKCYIVREISCRVEALEWIAKQSRLDRLADSLNCLVRDYLNEPKNWIVESVDECSSRQKRRRLTITEKNDNGELLMQLGTLLVQRYGQDTERDISNNEESWIQIFVTFLNLVEQNSIVLDSVLETAKQTEWKDAFAVMGDLLTSHLSSHLLAWQGILSLLNISFSLIVTRTEEMISCISYLDNYQLLNNRIPLQVMCRLLTKYSERRQLNIFLDHVCKHMVHKSVSWTLCSSFQSTFVSCMKKTTPEEFSDIFNGILQSCVHLYQKSSLVYENQWKNEKWTLHLMFLLLKSLIQKMSNRESSSLYWNCLNKTFEEWISPYVLKDEKDTWIATDVESCNVISFWMSCEVNSLLLFPNSNLKTEYLEQLLHKLEDLASTHSFDPFSVTDLSTYAYWLELLTNFLSIRKKWLEKKVSKREPIAKHTRVERVVIKRWLIPCIISIRDHLYSVNWNDHTVLLVSFQIFESLWMSLQHMASYFLLTRSNKHKNKYFSIWTKLFFPLLLTASSHCYFHGSSKVPQWILDDWSGLVTRLLDWGVIGLLWEHKHFRKVLFGYWKCVIRQLSFRGGLVTVQGSSNRDVWIKPLTDSLSFTDSLTLLHSLWDNGIVSMILHYQWMLSHSFLEWIGKHYVSLVSERSTVDNAWRVKVEKFLCDAYLCRNGKYSPLLNCILMEPSVLLAFTPYVATQTQVSHGWLYFLKWLTKKHSESCEKLQNWLSKMIENLCTSRHCACNANGLFYLVVTLWKHVSQPRIGNLLKESILRWIQHVWSANENRYVKIEALCLVIQYGKKRKNQSLVDMLQETFDGAFEILRKDIMDEGNLSGCDHNSQARRFVGYYLLWKNEAILSQLPHSELTSLLLWFLEPLGDASDVEQQQYMSQLMQLCSVSFWRQMLETCWLQLVDVAVSHPSKFLIACRLCYALLQNAGDDWEKERTIIRQLYRLLFMVSIADDDNLFYLAGESAMNCLRFIVSRARYSDSVEEYDDTMSSLFLVQRWYLQSIHPYTHVSIPWEQICQIFSRALERLRKSGRYPVGFLCNYVLMLMDSLFKEAEPFPYVAWIHRLWDPLLGWMNKGLSNTWSTWFLFQVVELVEQQKPSLFHQPLFIVELNKLLQCKPEETLASGNLVYPKESVMENVKYFLQRYSERYRYKGKA